VLIDVHVHTAFSEGFTVTAAEAVERCRHIGIDAIVLAECDVIPDLDEVRALSEDMSFPIFVGVDVDAADGRVIAIAPDPTDERFVSQSWASHDARPTVRDVIEALTQMDGVVIAAHPYLDDGGPFLGDALYDTEGLTAVEVLCGVRSRLSNDLALEATVATGLPAVGGSDTGRASGSGSTRRSSPTR